MKNLNWKASVAIALFAITLGLLVSLMLWTWKTADRMKAQENQLDGVRGQIHDLQLRCDRLEDHCPGRQEVLQRAIERGNVVEQ